MSNPITRFFSSEWRKFRAFWIIDFLTEEEQLLSSSPKQRTLDAPLLEDIDSSTSDGQSGDVWRKEGFSHTWKRLPGGFVESVELGKHPRLLCKDDAQMLADGWRKVIPPKDKVARTKFSGPGPDSHPPEPEAPLPDLLPCKCGRHAVLTTDRGMMNEWTAQVDCSAHAESLPPEFHTGSEAYCLDVGALDAAKYLASLAVITRWNVAAAKTEPPAPPLTALRAAEARLLACKCGAPGRVFWQVSDFETQLDIKIRCQDFTDEALKEKHTEPCSSTTRGIVDMQRAKVLALDALAQRWDAAAQVPEPAPEPLYDERRIGPHELINVTVDFQRTRNGPVGISCLWHGRPCRDVGAGIHVIRRTPRQPAPTPERTHAMVHQEWEAARLAVHAAQEKLRALRLELDALESKLLAERAEASK